jgi:hypothetical protein
VIVGAGGEDFLPGLGVRGGDRVAIGEFVDLRGREGGEGEASGFAEERVAVAVEALEMAEEEDELLDVRPGEAFVEAVEWVRDGVDDLRGGEVTLEVEDVLAQGVDFAVLQLGDAPDEDVGLAAIFRKTGADLFADEDAGEVGDFEAALDAVVIGDGDQVHAAIAQLLVKRAGFRTAIREADAAEEPLGRPAAVAGVKMEVGFHGRGMRLGGRVVCKGIRCGSEIGRANGRRARCADAVWKR